MNDETVFMCEVCAKNQESLATYNEGLSPDPKVIVFLVPEISEKSAEKVRSDVTKAGTCDINLNNSNSSNVSNALHDDGETILDSARSCNILGLDHSENEVQIDALKNDPDESANCREVLCAVCSQVGRVSSKTSTDSSDDSDFLSDTEVNYSIHPSKGEPRPSHIRSCLLKHEESEDSLLLLHASINLKHESNEINRDGSAHSSENANMPPDASGDFDEEIFFDAPLPEDFDSSSEIGPAYSATVNGEPPSEDEDNSGILFEEARTKGNYKIAEISDSLEDSSLTPETKRKASKYRRKLPQLMHSRSEFSIWSVLKQCVGKDLSRIAMPVIFNEPLSFLQRISEYLDYIEILEKATTIDDPIERLLNVAIYMISCNASTDSRIGKPFNPLLGETFELTREDKRVKLVAEQVCHHPPISALYVEGSAGFTIELSMEPVLKFWGKDVEIKPRGSCTIRIPKYNDIYTFTYLSSAVHNIIVGTLWIELYGVTEIINHTTGQSCVINYKPCSWFGKDFNQLEGYVLDENKSKRILLKGDWTKYICTCPADKPEVFSAPPNPSTNPSTGSGEVEVPEGAALRWKARPKPPYAKDMYQMTEFAMSLNELTDEHRGVIAPTDSRFRPDIRALENGDIELAASEKLRLEEKQRAVRREMQAANQIWEARWFKLEEHDQLHTKEWVFGGDYFKRDFSCSPDIY